MNGFPWWALVIGVLIVVGCLTAHGMYLMEWKLWRSLRNTVVLLGLISLAIYCEIQIADWKFKQDDVRIQKEVDDQWAVKR